MTLSDKFDENNKKTCVTNLWTVKVIDDQADKI